MLGRPAHENGSILIGLLWCLAILSVVVVGVLHTARLDLTVGKNFGDRIQAHYLAIAGIEQAKALLYQDALQRSRSAQNHTGNLYDAPQQFRDVPLGRGEFRVFRRGREDEGGGIIYGVSDEESRLNMNYISMQDMRNLQGMTPDVAAAISDWRDNDKQVTPGGAEIEYYASLKPPSQPRDGPIQSVRELLMIRGMQRDLLLGDDSHQNGLLDQLDENGRDLLQGAANTGWAGFMTVDSSVDDVNASGDDRVSIQTADESALSAIHGITPQIAKAIVTYRNQHRFDNLADLLDVTAPPQNQTQNQSGNNRNSPGPQGQPQGNNNNAAGGPNAGGPNVISQDLFRDIADDIAVQSEGSQAGVLNINTAGRDALICLPGISRELAQAIISYRQSNGAFANIAWLLRVPGMSKDIFKQIAGRVTARSETYRILCEGKVKSSGARKRIQEIVHVGLHNVTTISYREDDL